MRPNPKSSATAVLSSPFLPVGGDDDDDDDFQSPSHARLRRPLKISSGSVSHHPCKKLKPSYSSGKENHPVAGGTVCEEKAAAVSGAAAGAETLAIGSTVRGGVPEGKNATDGEICLFLRSGCEPSDDSKLGTSGKELGGFGSCMGCSRPSLTELRLSESNVKCDFGSEGCEELREVGSRACSAVPEERRLVVEERRCDLSSKEEWSESGGCKGRYHSNLIELRPVELRTECNFGGVACEVAQEFGSISEERNVGKDAGVASQFEVNDSERSGFGVSKGNYHLNSIESKLLQSNARYNFGGGDCSGAQKLGSEACIMVSEGRNVAAEDYVTSEYGTRENKSSVSEACKRGHSSNSIESKLLESSMNHSFEGDNCDDFEIGTQLNELINLCMEEDVEGHSDSRASPMQGNKMDSGMFESDCQVECPLCGSDISDLSEEMRQMHTNNCLDKDEPDKETNSHQERESCPGGGTLGNRCVVEWLRNLGLSRYEEVFVREEVDWETLQWFKEEDLLSIGITSLGPRKKIIHALGELRKKADHANDVEANVLNSSNTAKAKLPMTGNKLITEYFHCPSFDHRRACKASKPSNLNSQKNSSVKMATSRSHAGKGKVKDIPLWCCIPGTPFRVDAFRYLRGDCCHWFLTHFHLDHYQGLTRSFCHGKIYCSSITAHLVNHKIGVPWDRLHVLPLNQKITIAGINLTCFDANHCPGSLIILFEPPNGKAVLHTGDFRFSSEMANNPVLQSCHVHTLILDTTYCNPRYDFPNQETVIQFVIEAIQAEAFNPKTLFLIGSYTIGKERLFMEVARLLQKKIYVGAAKLQILKFLELPEEIMHRFTANETESHIHVVPMWTLASVKRMKYFSSQYANRFDLIVAFCPTGWSFGKGRKRTPGRRWQQGTVIRYEVPYSEHSSFTELREFVRFISPEHIVPSVNNNGPESADAMLAQLLRDL